MHTVGVITPQRNCNAAKVSVLERASASTSCRACMGVGVWGSGGGVVEVG